MKYVLPLLPLIICSCVADNSEVSIVKLEITRQDENMHPAPCSVVTDYVQSYDNDRWEKTIQRIRNTYTNVVAIVSDKETIDFTVAFFNALSASEEIDQQSRNLYETNHNHLPNTDSLVFFYRAEKKFDELLTLLNQYANSSNKKIKECAMEAEDYIRCQKNFFIAIREIDYRTLELSRLSQVMPPEVLRAHAKLLEQRESMSNLLISFYESFVTRTTK